MSPRYHSFTNQADNRSNVLQSTIGITPAFTPSEGVAIPEPRQYVAIWDTGATNSVVTRKVVEECGLIPTGVVEVNLAGGSDERNTYFVAIGLPNGVMFPQVKVTDAETLVGGDVLIGMDIIGQGDFAVSHGDGKTTFTFRYPSLEVINFVEQDRATKRAQDTIERKHKLALRAGKSTKEKSKSVKKTRDKKRKKK